MSTWDPLEPIEETLAKLERSLGEASQSPDVARSMDEVRTRSRELAQALSALLELLGGEVTRSLSTTRSVVEGLTESLQGTIPEADRQVLAAVASRTARLLELVRSTTRPPSARHPAPGVLGSKSSGVSWEVPPSPASAAKPTRPAADAPTIGDVLVCDVDPLIRRMLSKLLGNRGFAVTTVSSIEEALQTAAASPPDALVIDPVRGTSGVSPEVARIGNAPGLKGVPVLVCTASQPVDAPGFSPNEWLLKPVATDTLIKALEKAIRPEKGRPSRRVLLVEDNDNLARLLTYIIEKTGAEVVRARTGLKAIQMSRRALPDMVVLDVGLPEFDGFAVVEWMKQYERTRDLPLLVYTGRDLEDEHRARLKLGRTEYLKKGEATTEEIEQRLVSLLEEAGGNGRGIEPEKPSF